jgi:hypothetical protein
MDEPCRTDGRAGQLRLHEEAGRSAVTLRLDADLKADDVQVADLA